MPNIRITRTEIDIPETSPIAVHVIKALSGSSNNPLDLGDLTQDTLPPAPAPIAALPPAWDVPAQAMPPTGPGQPPDVYGLPTFPQSQQIPVPERSPWWSGLMRPIRFPAIPADWWLMLVIAGGSLAVIAGLALYLASKPVLVQETDQVPDARDQPEPEPQSSLFDPANPPMGVMTAPDGTPAPDGVLATLPPPPVVE